ncbi:hypothetical protein LJC41_01220, partial [Desulfosarcina sp. OttesenSCG-928-G17]|nr:hypothetical protein [Desulfosarcina sp. OttesenSCG-928-G17]
MTHVSRLCFYHDRRILSMDNGYDLHPTGLTAPCPSPPQNGLSADLKTRLMLAMLAPAAGESILDIGCGT